MTSETSAQPERERRLATLRERTRSRRASETAEAREQRLATLRDQTRSRRASETAEAREQRLATLRDQTRSPRLSQDRLSHLRRRAAESPAERGARLQDLRTRQQERIASETPEETAARRQRDRETHSHRPPAASAQPLLHQPAVQARMRKFHSQLASLEVSTCTTCLERFPGMTTRHTAAGTECTRCHRDTHTPKAENNMHPGPVPMELKVRC